jgi:hypothetical protein
MTDEQRNIAQDILNGALRDAYSLGFGDAMSEAKSIINELKEQNELMISILKELEKQISVGYEVYNILTPETISDISSIIQKVEGEKE